MTREEFSLEIKKYKDSAMVNLAEAIPLIFKLGNKRIERIEKAEENYNMPEVFLYLQMCNASLHIMCYDEVWVETMEELGKAINAEREANELTITELAKKSHVSSTIISALERGRCNLKIDSFLQIAEALELIIEIE